MKSLHSVENFDDPNDIEDENFPTTVEVSDSQFEALNITKDESFEDEFNMEVSHDITLEHPRQSVPKTENSVRGIDHEDHGENF